MNTLFPGFAQEGKLMVISALSVDVDDAGADGDITPSSSPTGLGCPPTCGTGDEHPYLVQGLFTP